MWGELPADALAVVFAFLPRNDKSLGGCRLVCRSWRDVADTSPRIWGVVNITAPTAAASAGLAALLHKQRQCLGHIQLDTSALPDGNEEEEAQALAMILAAACGTGSQVSSVLCNGPMHKCMSDALPGSASHLIALVLRDRAWGGHGRGLRWSQLGHMPQLLSLSLATNFFEAGQPCPALTSLTRLTCLRLQPDRPSRVPPGLLPSVLLAAPPSLRRLELQAIDVELSGHWWPVPAEEPHFAEPDDAEDLAVNGVGSEAEAEGGAQPGGQGNAAVAAGQVAQPAAATNVQPTDSSASGTHAPKAIHRCLARLEALELRRCRVTREFYDVLPSCRALTSLHFAPKDCSPQAVECIARCSSLQDLVLGRYTDYRLVGLPNGALSQLTRLKISSSSELMKVHPSWCSLPKLLCFELESCEQLLHLPREFATLTQLQRLSLSHQRLEEFPQWATGLSQLTYLAVAACSLEQLPEGPYLRNLRHLNCFANNLTSVAPALAHPELGAPALRTLDLSSNYNHHLSAADVAVCSRLTALTFLDLHRHSEHAEAHAAGVVDDLRAALPHCTIHA